MKPQYNKLVIVALLLAIIALVLPEAIEPDVAFEIVKNNTDLCTFNHTTMICDGSRQNNVTYYTNNTSIVLYVFAHASAAGGVAGVFVYRDDKLIAAQSGRPLASPEQTWREVTAIIPKNSSYRVNFTDFHHFEWYEDQILSGKNGTLSINQTINGCVGDCSFNNLNVNSLGKNNSSDFFGEIRTLSPFGATKNIWHSTIDISDGSVSIISQNITSGNYSIFSSTPEFLALAVLNSASISLNISQDRINIISGVRDIMINESGIDLNNGNLTNCANCGGNQNLSQVLSIGNDANGSIIYNATFIGSMNYTNLTNAPRFEQLIYQNHTCCYNRNFINLTGLSINNDSFYKVYSVMNSTAALTLDMFINNDLNSSNYSREYVFAAGTTLISAYDLSTNISVNSASESGESRVLLKRAWNGKPRAIIEGNFDTLVFFNMQLTYNIPIDDITTINFRFTPATPTGLDMDVFALR